MPRPAKLWRRSENGCYYATIQGVQTRLSHDREEALELFHTLKSDARKKRNGRRSKPARKLATTLEEVCNAFLDDAKATKAEKTYENQKGYLQSFCDAVGKSRRVRDITEEEFDRWSRSKGWGKSTQTAARATIMACLNWGVRKGRLLESPLWGARSGAYRRRERILRAEEKKKIHQVLKGGLKDFVNFIEMTGCRPFSEAAKVTAAMIDWADGSVPFEQHKTE